MSIESMQHREFDIGRVISATFGVIGRNFAPFAGLAFLFSVIPQALIGWFSRPGGELPDTRLLGLFSVVAIVGGLLTMMFGWILQAALIRGAVDDLNGRKTSLEACLNTAVRNLGPVFLISVMMVLGIGLGSILLIIPGLILSVMWVVAIPAQVIEQRGVFASLERSGDLTRGSRWPIFGLLGLELLISAWMLHYAAARRRGQRGRAMRFAVAIGAGLALAVGLGWLSTRGSGGTTALLGLGSNVPAAPTSALGGLVGVAGYLVLRVFGWIREIVHAPMSRDGLPETRFGLQNGFHLLGLILFAFVAVLGHGSSQVVRIGFFALRALAEVTMSFTADALFARKA